MTDNYVSQAIGRGAFRSWARLMFLDLDLPISPWLVKEVTVNYSTMTVEFYYEDRNGKRINMLGYADGKAVTYVREFPINEAEDVFWPEYVGTVAA